MGAGGLEAPSAAAEWQPAGDDRNGACAIRQLCAAGEDKGAGADEPGGGRAC